MKGITTPTLDHLIISLKRKQEQKNPRKISHYLITIYYRPTTVINAHIALIEQAKFIDLE